VPYWEMVFTVNVPPVIYSSKYSALAVHGGATVRVCSGKSAGSSATRSDGWKHQKASQDRFTRYSSSHARALTSPTQSWPHPGAADALQVPQGNAFVFLVLARTTMQALWREQRYCGRFWRLPSRHPSTQPVAGMRCWFSRILPLAEWRCDETEGGHGRVLRWRRISMLAI
jgi:hypothetical protein